MAIKRSLSVSTGNHEFTAREGCVEVTDGADRTLDFADRTDVEDFIVALRESSKIAFPTA